jgi:hypothetical protein
MGRLRLPCAASNVVILIALSASSARGQGCGQWQPADFAGFPPSSLAAAVSANGEFWAFGFSAYGSPTGTMWTELGPGPDMELTQVRWTGSGFIALGYYGTLATSQDGLSWTQRVSFYPGIPETVLSDVAWNGSTYVAVGFYATESSGANGFPLIMVSSDLANWSQVDPPAGGGTLEQLNAIVWTGTRFVAVGRNILSGGGTSGVTFVSSDGRSWTRLLGPGGMSVAWSGSELVEVGGVSPGAWRSVDGTTWQGSTLPQDYALHAVVWDGSRFVAVGRDLQTAYALVLASQDGATWQPQWLAYLDDLVGVAGNLGVDVAVGQGGTILASNCSAPPSHLWVPVAAHNPGLNGSQWRTDLGLLNAGTVDANIDLRFYGPLSLTGGGAVSGTVAVPPGSQSILTDVVGQLGASGQGSLEIVSDQPVKVTSRTYNQVAPDASCYAGGTQGEDEPAVMTTDGLTVGQSAYLAGLVENASYRSNIGLVCTGSAATVLVELFDGSGGKLGDYTVTLPLGQWAQRTQPFKTVAGQVAMDRGYARVTVQSGSGVFAFASVVDNITNDPTAVTMQR